MKEVEVWIDEQLLAEHLEPNDAPDGVGGLLSKIDTPGLLNLQLKGSGEKTKPAFKERRVNHHPSPLDEIGPLIISRALQRNACRDVIKPTKLGKLDGANNGRYVLNFTGVIDTSLRHVGVSGRFPLRPPHFPDVTPSSAGQELTPRTEDPCPKGPPPETEKVEPPASIGERVEEEGERGGRRRQTYHLGEKRKLKGEESRNGG